ncbi:recombinase family protein [Burkholderia diffusa]|uniref:recombinase family protein n=1 Tax=Burkholderia diffusa TaxID=488732 RepID=UPI001E407C5C|nr:recombinase family protein [Burkholderia diffusa]
MAEPDAFRLDLDTLPERDFGPQESVLCRGLHIDKSGKQTTIVDGRAHKTYKHRKPFEEWEVLLKEHHEGYIDWAEFERNQKLLAANAYGKAGDVKSGRGGRALLAGLLGARAADAVCRWPAHRDRSIDAIALTYHRSA